MTQTTPQNRRQQVAELLVQAIQRKWQKEREQRNCLARLDNVPGACLYQTPKTTPRG